MARLRPSFRRAIEDAPPEADAIVGADDYRPRPPSGNFTGNIGSTGYRACHGSVTG
ncbi:MAG: hypothetical protein ABI910_19305 [Gemmatimonadota bacterium]